MYAFWVVLLGPFPEDLDRSMHLNIPKSEAQTLKPAAVMCSSCFWLAEFALLLPLLHSSLLTWLAEPQRALQLVFRGWIGVRDICIHMYY